MNSTLFLQTLDGRRSASDAHWDHEKSGRNLLTAINRSRPRSVMELRRGDESISLRPKCFDLLLYFLQNPERLIAKDELLQQIWNDVIVNERTINRTVTALRSSLDDDAENPMYIETVSRGITPESSSPGRP